MQTRHDLTTRIRKSVAHFAGLSVLVFGGIAATAVDDLPKKLSAMPIFVTPYYNSDGPRVSVGKFSDELAAATAASILDLAKTMKKEWRTLPTETMFVLAIRHYDLGKKDEATFWFHSARYRTVLLDKIIPNGSLRGLGAPGFERKQARLAFSRLAGVYITGHAFGDIPKVHEILGRVITEHESLPDFEAIYPDQTFVPADEQTELAKNVAATFKEFRDKCADPKFIEEAKAARKKNGIEGKY